MKQSEEPFDPSARVIPQGWNRPHAKPPEQTGAIHDTAHHQWMSTVEAPLKRVRECAQAVFAEMDAALAYLYESEDKVVIRCTRPRQQIRAELRPLEGEPHSTRIVVVVSDDSQVDRHASGRIVAAIESRLRVYDEA